jgi:hypothetical protein
MSSYRTNSDRYGDQVARMRSESAQAPAREPAQAPAREPLIKTDYIKVLIEAVKLDGMMTIQAPQLLTLLGFPEKDKQALANVLKTFSENGISHSMETIRDGSRGAITFSVTVR